MAGGPAISVSLNGHYNGKITWFVVASCVVAAMGGAIFGYDIGVSGGVTSMEPFLKKFFSGVVTKMKQDPKISNYCKFDSQLLTLFTSSLYFAGLFASLLASSATKIFGRKLSILIGGITVLAGSALGGAALNVYMLILGRILLGIAVGFANQGEPSGFTSKNSISGGFRREVEVRGRTGHQGQGKTRKIGNARPCIKAHGRAPKGPKRPPGRKTARPPRAWWHGRATTHGWPCAPRTAVRGVGRPHLSDFRFFFRGHSSFGLFPCFSSCFRVFRE